MKYYMRSRFFKLKEDFWIKDQSGKDVYFVDNKFMTLGLQFDIIKNRIIRYSVREKLLTFMSNYEIYEGKKSVGTVSQKMTFMKDKLKVDSKYGELLIKGDLFDYNYKIYQDGIVIANITKELFAFTDNYYVDINFMDEAFVLTLVVIIDNIIDKQKNRN